MKALNTQYITDFSQFVEYNMMTEKVKYAVFFVFSAFVFLFIWTPFVNNLNQNIWRTKGMLNMIPLEIMGKNENLKGAFLREDLLRAVK